MILKTSAANGSLSAALRFSLTFLSSTRSAFDSRNIERRGQVIDHRVEHRLHALVLERRAADHRENLHRDGRLADTGLDFGIRQRLAFDELLEQLVVEFGNRFDHLLAVDLGLFEQVFRNFDHVELGAQRFIAPDHGLHLDQIDNALELIFRAHRNLNRHRTRLQTIDDGIDGVDRNRRPRGPSC